MVAEHLRAAGSLTWSPALAETWNRALTASGVRGGVALAGRLVAGLARAVADPDRRREFSHRLLEYHQYEQFLGAVVEPRKTFAGHAPDFIPFPLLVTTNQGLYLLERGAWHCLLPITCFGLARHEDNLFLGASAGIHSFILSATITGKDNVDGLRAVRILSRYETRYHNERIHQIAYDPRAKIIHGANCRRNSLIAVDPNGRGTVDEKFLFVDGTGFRITTDQNHINSVTMNGDAILFAAHSAGSGGALGFVAGDMVRAYQYQARGIHDVVIHDDGIMFTDSFRNKEAENCPQANGAIWYRGGEYLSQAIGARSRKLVLRGLAMRGTVLVVGVSAFARRDERLTEAGGGVVVFCDGEMLGLIEGPFAQVYDILPADGRRTDAAGPTRSVAELDSMFQRDVGPLLFERPLRRDVRKALDQDV
jgi:hypothetical protein